MNEVVSAPAAVDAHLAEVLDAYLAAMEAGAAPARAELLAQHPELADQLAACLASLDFIRRAAPGSSFLEQGAEGPAGVSGPARRAEPIFRQPGLRPGEQLELGDYRLLREIGRGGMGIVYEARQLSSGRPVALKVLPFSSALDSRQLLRFKNEAEAASRFQHPNIVPVWDVGAQGDLHFYVMKFIEGQTLAKIIRERKAETPNPAAAPTVSASATPEQVSSKDSYYRTVAKLGLQAALGLEHAHQAGIVHRDIKPGNLLVDQGLHLWITDFGLARILDDAGNLTLSGDLVGTLRYMSPEQTLAKLGIVDQRSDIYSLGVTLYELATLEPAFRGQDRQELLRQIAEDEPVPPRRLNPAIPEPLETILLKAITKELTGRYATAQEMADDLERFLANRPIAARRPSRTKRLGRWLRRHQRIAAGAVAAGFLAVLVLATSWFIILQERNEAERRAQQALQAVDEMYTQVAQRWWQQQPFMEQVQREFLLKALHYYEDFSKERGSTPYLRLETARAASRVGDIQHKLGELAKAEDAYNDAIARLQKMVADESDDVGQRAELALAYSNRGTLERDLGKLPDALKDYSQAQTLFAALSAEDDQNADYREGLAGTLGNVGLVQHALGRPKDADQAFHQSLKLFERLAKDYPKVPAYCHGLAGCRNNLANLLRDTGRPHAAQLTYEQAAADWQSLTRDMPGLPVFRQSLAAAYSGLGIVHAAQGRVQDAEKSHRQALALRDRLTQDYPGVVVYRQALAASYQSLARLRAAAGQFENAHESYAQALDLRKKLVADMPSVAMYRQELADTHEGLAGLLAASGNIKQAEPQQRLALGLRQQLVEELPDLPEPRWDLARCRRVLANFQSSLGHDEEAEQLFHSALAQDEQLTAAYPAVHAFRLELASCRGDMGVFRQHQGRLSQAEKLLRSAQAERQQLVKDFPAAPYYRLELAIGQGQLAGLFKDAGQAEAAESAGREALSLAQTLTQDFAGVSDYNRRLALAQKQLGELLLAAGKSDEANQLLAQARLLREKLAAEAAASKLPR
jgi:serine/threonine protein kinase